MLKFVSLLLASALCAPAFAADGPRILVRSDTAAAVAADGRPATVIDGHLRREAVDKALAAGPQRLIAAVSVAPQFAGKKFVGFRIVGIDPNAPFARGETIRVGDVVRRVNREPIERPDQFMRAWEVVSGADTIEIEILRDGRAILYRWKITL